MPLNVNVIVSPFSNIIVLFISSTNFADLQRQLEDTEDKIAFARQFYNSNVLEYNTKIRLFPNSIIANAFSFKEEQFFEAKPEEREKVAVKF